MPKKFHIILIALFACLAYSVSFSGTPSDFSLSTLPPNSTTQSDPSSPVIPKQSLDKAFEEKEGILDALIGLVTPKIIPLQKELEHFGDCNEKAKTKNWVTWRNNQILCGSAHQKPDDFRRMVVRRLEKIVVEILEGTGSIPSHSQTIHVVSDKTKKIIEWVAIGTPGPNSDIDDVAQYIDALPQGHKKLGYLPKIVAEVRAKSLFDALGIALYGQPTGVAFDTESYIDVTDDLNKENYEKRIQDKLYQKLAITLAFSQVARQLEHGIELTFHQATPKGVFQSHPSPLGSNRSQPAPAMIKKPSKEKIYGYNDFEAHFNGSPFLELLKDAHGLSKATYPLPDPKENIRHYLPVINYLATAVEDAKKSSDNLMVPKIKGVLATYFPESYFAREALAHVCYSDDRYSQLLLKLIKDHLDANKGSGQLDPDKITELKKETITPNPFVYAVSALENLGYFFHKLDQQDNPYEALKNSAKYFFRVARALAGYWGVTETDIDSPSELGSEEKKYVKSLYGLASKLERLKRGFLPFSSPDYIENLLSNINKSLGAAKIKEHATTLYSLYNNIYLSREEKLKSLRMIAADFQDLMVYEENLGRFDLGKSNEEVPLFTKASQKRIFQNKKQVLENQLQKKSQKIMNMAEAGQKINSAIKNASLLELVSLMNLTIGVDNDSKNMKLQKIRKESALQVLETPKWKDPDKLNAVGNLTNGQFKSFLNDLVLFMKHTLENFAQQTTLTPQSLQLSEFAAQQIRAATESSPSHRQR